MKKAWNSPAIAELDLSATAYQSAQGDVVDGQYQDKDDCLWYDAYKKS